MSRWVDENMEMGAGTFSDRTGGWVFFYGQENQWMMPIIPKKIVAL